MGGLGCNFALKRFEDSFDWTTGRHHIDRHCHFGVFWIEQGSGELQVDQSLCSFGPASLILVSPGQLTSWKQVSPVRGEIALFTEEFLSLGPVAPGLLAKMPFLGEAPAHVSLSLGGEAAEAMSRMFAELRQETEIAEIGQDDQIRAWIALILGQARRLFASVAPAVGGLAQSPLAWRFRVAVAQNFPRLRLAGEYAQMLKISRQQLNDEVMRQLGCTASEVIHDRTILEAKRLLVHTALTISEIAYELQFQDPSYFVRFFRRLTGVTPRRFRMVENAGLAGD